MHSNVKSVIEILFFIPIDFYLCFHPLPNLPGLPSFCLAPSGRNLNNVVVGGVEPFGCHLVDGIWATGPNLFY